jgi:hypothetical protein
MALSPFMIFYSTEARAYALVTALALVSTLALRNATENGSRRWWIAYAAFSCAAVYAQYTAVFVLVAQFVWALAYHRASARALIAANLAAAIGFLPWLPALIDNTRSAGTQAFALLEPFNLTDVSRDLAHWGIGHPYIQLGAVPGGLAIVLVLLGVLNAGALAAVGKLAVGAPGAPGAPGRPSRPSSGIVLAVALAIAAPLGLVLYSLLRESIWDPRNLCISSPGLALVLGALLTSSRAPLVRLVSVGAVVVGFAIGATKLLEARYERPDYAGAAALVLRTGGARDPVAVVPVPTPGPLSAMDAAFAYAGDRGRELQRIGTAPLAAVLRAAPYALLAATPPGVLAAQSARRPGDRLFVVAPGTASLANLLRSGRVNTRAVLGPVFGTGRNGLLLGTVYAPLSAYLKAVARRFRPLGTRTFPGFLRLSVYVFARR